jgi:tetratricopeptide (TPR) repeat protein
LDSKSYEFLHAYSAKGDAYNRLHRYEDAANFFQNGLKMSENDDYSSRFQLGLGDALRGMSKHQEAIECYRRAIYLDYNSDRVKIYK